MRIILPCYLKDQELVDLTVAAVESLRGNEITIIDNGSPMGGGLLRELADEYIRNKTNLGYAKAVNQGLKLHMGEVVAVANNDVRVGKNWMDVANEIMKDPLVCSVHFRMIPYNQPWNPGNETWIQGKERWCSSSFFVVMARQLYDNKFLNSYDDYDYWYRWRQKGFRQAYTNKAEYQHLDSSTVQRIPKHAEVNTENYEYYKKKHGEYPDIQFANDFPEQMNINYRPFP
jgi:GT2 family glycosyltransferase